MRLSPAQIAELETVRALNGGVLNPEAVRDFARSANTALHPLFSNPDAEDAEKWRLHVARECIRAVVTLLPNPSADVFIPVRAYSHDARAGGYRVTAQLLSDEQSAAILLQQMRNDLVRVTSRYRRFAALVPHIEAVLDATTPPEEEGAEEQ